jgi:predicted RND superfamily exporter protein
MIEKLIEKSLAIFKKPRLIIAAAAVITLLLIPGLFRLQVDNDIHNMLPKDHPAVRDSDRFLDVFGNSDLIFIGFETDNIYKEEVFKYLQQFGSAVLDLNKTLPALNIAGKMRLSTAEASAVVNALNEQAIMSADDVKALLTSKERLESEAFMEAKQAEKIARAAAGADFEAIYKLYRPPVKKVDSLASADFIKGSAGKFSVTKLLRDGVVSPANIEEAKKRAGSWEMYQGLLVSKDSTMTSVMVQLSTSDITVKSSIYQGIKKILEQTKPASFKAYIAGEPVLAYAIGQSIIHDMALLIPFVIIIVTLALYVSFRNFQGVFYPMLSLGICVIWTFGLMGYCGIPINLVSSTLPVILVALGSAYGIHFMNNYFLIHSTDKLKSVEQNLTTVGVGIFVGALTTMAGFFALLSTHFVPLKNFGLFTGIGVFFALMISLYLIPAMLLTAKREKINFANEEEKHGVVLKFLEWLNSIVQKRYKLLIALSVVLSLVSVISMTGLKVEMNNADFFKKSSVIRSDDDRLNAKLDGTQEMDVVLESARGSVLEPAVLSMVESYGEDVQKAFPRVQRVMGINQYLKKMNQEMNGGPEKYYTLPETAQKANDYLLLYSGQLDNFITSKHDKMRFNLVIKRSDTAMLEKVQKYTQAYFKPDFLAVNGLKLTVSGVGELYVVANNLITWGEVTDILISLAAVFAIMFIDFGSIGLTLVALWPIVVALLMNFGFMALIGIPLNAATAIVASLAIGTGIDYSIHFIVKYRQEMALSNGTVDVGRAIHNTIMQRGRSIMYNVLAVMAGFFVMLFSSFVPLIQFGGLVGFSMITTGIGAVLMIPATLKYLEKGGKILS